MNREQAKKFLQTIGVTHYTERHLETVMSFERNNHVSLLQDAQDLLDKLGVWDKPDDEYAENFLKQLENNG